MSPTYGYLRAHWVSIAVATFALVSCVPPDARTAPGECQGENRPPLDCSSEFQYDATNMKGGFTALGIGNLTADSEKKALRDIDKETERYIAQARRLCDEYNKCVLDRGDYATRSENLRRRLAHVPELYEQLKNAAAPESKRRVLSQAYTEILPESERVEVQLEMQVRAKASSGEILTVHDGDSLRTGTRLRFLLSVSKDAYVYLFQRNSKGKFNVLFPDARMQLVNPVAAAHKVSIPPDESQTFRLDENDLGEETVYVVASLQPIGWLQHAGARESTNDTDFARLSAIGNDPNCQTRALTLENEPSANPCVRQRGLVLDSPNGSPPTTISARSEAGDGVIARVFSFHHSN